MLSRRSVLGASAAIFAATQSGSRAAESGPLRFGVIADPQYADAPPNTALNRYYGESLWKLRDAVAAFNAQDLRFVVTLGDLIDRDRRSYESVLSIYETLRHRHVALLGNHDFEVGAEHLLEVAAILGMTRFYGDFPVGGIRFIALDGNDVSLFAPPPSDPRWQLASDRLGRLKDANALNAKPWNGSLGDPQFAWLRDTLESARMAGERVVVMNHYPVFPENMHNLWDSKRVVDLLTAQKHVVAYFNGHNHAGNYGEADGLHFINFKGMVDTPTENAYALVTIEGDRLDIAGFGREPSRSLKLRSA